MRFKQRFQGDMFIGLLERGTDNRGPYLRFYFEDFDEDDGVYTARKGEDGVVITVDPVGTRLPHPSINIPLPEQLVRARESDPDTEVHICFIEFFAKRQIEELMGNRTIPARSIAAQKSA
jgi:hypothetical protein